MALQSTATIIANSTDAEAKNLIHAGRIINDRTSDTPRIEVVDNATVVRADISLRGSQRFMQNAGGRIEGQYATVLLSSENDVIDSGYLAVRHVLLQANNHVERTDTAETQAHSLRLGLSNHATKVIIDNGRIFVSVLPASFINDAPPLVVFAQAEAIYLGDTHRLQAPYGVSQFNASVQLTVAANANQVAQTVLYCAPQAAIQGALASDTLLYQVDQTPSDAVHAMLTSSGNYQQWSIKKELTVQTIQPIQYVELPSSKVLFRPEAVRN